MKKIFFCVALLAVVVSSCKKKNNDPSITVTASAPTITIAGSQYYSIPVGGTLPAIAVTAYDSFYNETDQAIIDQSTLDNTTPGLYTLTISAKNKYGMVGYTSIYIGVTSASAALNLSGIYISTDTPANHNRVASVTKLGTGLFMTNNVAGVDITSPATGIIASAVFVVTSDSTIDFGSQETVAAGLLSASSQMLSLAVGDTTLSYMINNDNFPAQTVTFVKQ